MGIIYKLNIAYFMHSSLSNIQFRNTKARSIYQKNPEFRFFYSNKSKKPNLKKSHPSASE